MYLTDQVFLQKLICSMEIDQIFQDYFHRYQLLQHLISLFLKEMPYEALRNALRKSLTGS